MSHPLALLLCCLFLVSASCQAPTQPRQKKQQDWSALTLTEPPSASAHALANEPGWERKNTVFYHVWVSAFADSDADSTGDLNGITARIDDGYFEGLGVNALWLSPVFRAASLTVGAANKHGYDTVDYYGVGSLYGSEADLLALLDHAHSRGLRVIFDFVPNHTAAQNPWFQNRDWYVARSSKPAGWRGFDSFGDWYSYPFSGGGFYYGVFGAGMPDLNYRNPEVRNQMASVAAHWLNAGFDGLRVDAVKYLVEGSDEGQWFDQPETFLWFQALRAKVLDPYTALGSAKFMVAENWDSDLASLKAYLVKDGRPAFGLTFDFTWPSVVATNLSGGGTAQEKANLLAALVTRPNQLPEGTAFATFQSNHDNVVDRPGTSYWGADAGPRLFLAAGLSLLGKGVPFVYYGNELGMTGAAGNDLNLRQPFDWNREAAQQVDADSLWSWHAALIRLRTVSPAWNDPRIASVASPAGTLAWVVTGSGGLRVAVAANLKNTEAAVTLAGLGDVSLARTVLGAGQPTPGEGSLALTLPPFGLRAFALDETDPEVVRATDGDGSAYEPPPLVYPTLYLRGTMNGWGTTALVSEGRVFYQDFTAVGTVAFKFGSADWGTALGALNTVYDESRGGLPASGFSTDGDGNLVFAAAGTYRAYLDTGVSPPAVWVVSNP